MQTRPSGAEPSAVPLLLAPGGDEECVRAALLAGADAVYLGLPRFNARMRATNIDEPKLAGLVRLAHQRSARIYLTMNTLLTQTELGEALATAERASGYGVDALIVQDWGLLAGLRDLAELGRFRAEIHASTQMTTHNASQIELLAGFGVRQVILARELDLEEVRALSARARSFGMRTEVFVHGAYCISVSGQCTMSSLVAGRSGNRGECAQPCRRRYRDDRGRPCYPLSLKDCSLFTSLGELTRAGVGGLKIEGRMKGADYVWTVVRAYRRELDRIARGEAPTGGDATLAAVFNRGFHDGYARSSLTADMFGEPFDASLEPMGAVRSFTADLMLLRTDAPSGLGPGDALAILTADRALQVCKARVLRRAAADTVELRIEGELKGRIVKGCLVYRQPVVPGAAEARLQAAGLTAGPDRIEARVEGRAGSRLRVTFSSGGRSATVESETALKPAERHALADEPLRRALGRLGGTTYVLDALDSSGLETGLFVPVSELNELRRRAVGSLDSPPASPAALSPPAGRRAVASPALRRLPRFGVILSDPAQALALHERGVLVFLEVTGPAPFDPAVCVPLFPAVIFDHQMADCLAVVGRPGIRAVASDNVGLGYECARAGVPWIAGPRANMTNAASPGALASGAGAAAFFHSPEIDLAQLRDQPATPGMQSLLTIAGPILTMTIRQCIIRNLEGCSRARTGRECVASCRRSAVMRDEAGRPFYVEKRPGAHTEVYNGSILWYPRAVRLLGDRVQCFVLDLRDLGFFSLPFEDKLTVVDGFLHGGRSAEEGAHALARFGSLTRGGFARGLQSAIPCGRRGTARGA